MGVKLAAISSPVLFFLSVISVAFFIDAMVVYKFALIFYVMLVICSVWSKKGGLRCWIWSWRCRKLGGELWYCWGSRMVYSWWKSTARWTLCIFWAAWWVLYILSECCCQLLRGEVLKYGIMVLNLVLFKKSLNFFFWLNKEDSILNDLEYFLCFAFGIFFSDVSLRELKFTPVNFLSFLEFQLFQ